jgi:hypothetical protein
MHRFLILCLLTAVACADDPTMRDASPTDGSDPVLAETGPAATATQPQTPISSRQGLPTQVVHVPHTTSGDDGVWLDLTHYPDDCDELGWLDQSNGDAFAATIVAPKIGPMFVEEITVHLIGDAPGCDTSGDQRVLVWMVPRGEAPPVGTLPTRTIDLPGLGESSPDVWLTGMVSPPIELNEGVTLAVAVELLPGTCVATCRSGVVPNATYVGDPEADWTSLEDVGEDENLDVSALAVMKPL